MHVTITPDAPHISYCKKKNVTTIIDVLMLFIDVVLFLPRLMNSLIYRFLEQYA